MTLVVPVIGGPPTIAAATALRAIALALKLSAFDPTTLVIGLDHCDEDSVDGEGHRNQTGLADTPAAVSRSVVKYIVTMRPAPDPPMPTVNSLRVRISE